MSDKTIVVAVVGNPNCGKSTLINAIAGSRLQVGNWPGVTVEKKEATFDINGQSIRLVDLPGCYSLSPYSQEEIITRDYLVQERPDLIVNVVDATNLERNLYLSIQLLELGLPMIMALNIIDEAEQKGLSIDTSLIEKNLGISVIPTSAVKKIGLDQLLLAIGDIGKNLGVHTPRKQHYGLDIEQALTDIEVNLCQNHPSLMDQFPKRWLMLKLMVGDDLVLKEINIGSNPIPQNVLTHLLLAHDHDIEGYLADIRYGLANGLTREAVVKPSIKRPELTERLDKIVLHRIFGIPIFILAMWLLFKLTFDLSSPFSDWLDEVLGGPVTRWVTVGLEGSGAPAWFVSLATEGVIAGVGSVLVFVPVIFTMMFFITFLEGSGYMARAAFVMDKAMHAIGLHGKSFIPMLLGFGCNVPSIYATRMLENKKDKILTALLIPLMSCGARLPVYVLFTAVFFPNNAGTVIWSLYLLGMALAVVMGFIFKKTLFRGEAPVFIMELPPYRIPSLMNLLIHTWEKGKHFLIKAGTYIFAVSVAVWFMLNLPWGVENKRDSYLGIAGATIAPLFQPLGFGNWEASSALITGVIAKEVVVGTMGEIYVGEKDDEEKDHKTVGQELTEVATSFGTAASKAVRTLLYLPQEKETEEDQKGLQTALQGQFTPLSSFAFMAFVLLYMPCFVVGAAMRHEFGGWKWVGVAFGYSTVLAWFTALIIYQGGRFLGLG